MQSYTIRGKKITIHNDNRIYVDGRDTKIKIWSSSSTKYSNTNSGQKTGEISGMDLESALYLKGWL